MSNYCCRSQTWKFIVIPVNSVWNILFEKHVNFSYYSMKLKGSADLHILQGPNETSSIFSHVEYTFTCAYCMHIGCVQGPSELSILACWQLPSDCVLTWPLLCNTHPWCLFSYMSSNSIGGSNGEEYACEAEDTDLIPGKISWRRG